jgi:hypothetical protein
VGTRADVHDLQTRTVAAAPLHLGRADHRARLAVQQQPGHQAAQQHLLIAPDGRVHVGGVTADRDLLDPAQHREPVPRGPERLPAGVVFSRGERPVHAAGQDLLDEEVLLEHQLLADARRAQPGEQLARPGTHVLPAAERVQVTLADRDPAHHVGPAPQQVEAEHRTPVVPDHGDVAQP